MIKRDSNSLTATPTCGKTVPSSRKKGCRAFNKLKEWQVRQYRIAVDENKWYMGERRKKEVSWKEAEQDFLHNGYYGCAPKWRQEYCAALCNHFSTCNLGQHFCITSNPKKKPTESL